jgi:hypothetical protein
LRLDAFSRAAEQIGYGSAAGQLQRFVRWKKESDRSLETIIDENM